MVGHMTHKSHVKFISSNATMLNGSLCRTWKYCTYRPVAAGKNHVYVICDTCAAPTPIRNSNEKKLASVGHSFRQKGPRTRHLQKSLPEFVIRICCPHPWQNNDATFSKSKPYILVPELDFLPGASPWSTDAKFVASSAHRHFALWKFGF